MLVQFHFCSYHDMCLLFLAISKVPVWFCQLQIGCATSSDTLSFIIIIIIIGRRGGDRKQCCLEGSSEI